MSEIELDKSNNTYTDEELREIIKQHKLWLDTKGKGGKRADLSSAVLVGANLMGANLYKASLIGTNLKEANLMGANLCGVELKEANLMGANLYRADLRDADLRNTNCENTIFINTRLDNIKIEKTKLLGAIFLDSAQQELFLNHNIQEAQKALANSLTSADDRIKEYSENAKWIGRGAIVLIILDLCAVIHLWFFHKTFISPPQGMGAWALTLYSFPILIVFSIAITLFRHQEKLLDEVRHYSANKRQIELSRGLLEASQYVAMGLYDPETSAMHIQDTFSVIRDRLLSEQPHTNTAGSAVEQEEYSSSLEPLIKVISDMIAKSEMKK